MEVEKKSVNGLGIASLAFGIVGILTICGCGIGFIFGILGIILGILGLTVLKNSGKGFPIAGLIVSGIATVFGSVWVFLYLPNHNNTNTPSYANTTTSSIASTSTDTAANNTASSKDAGSSSSNKDNSIDYTLDDEDADDYDEDLEASWNEVKDAWNELKNEISSSGDNSSEENNEEEKKNPLSEVKTVGINEEFGNKTITGKVTDVNLNYTDYNDMWTTVPDGKKCIYIKIKVTNISNESNYVTVSDFDCYVDDVSVTAELVNGNDGDDFNANIEPGRSAILGALYVVPKDCESIELEYNPLGEYAERVIIKIK